MTPYAKTPKTNEEIADILEVRGLAFDRGELLAFLSRVGYYRLKGYLVPFRKPLDEAFIAYGDPAIDSVFVLMSVVRYLVSVIHPNSAWLAKSRTQVEAATPFVLRGMGFPVGWQELALWK